MTHTKDDDVLYKTAAKYPLRPYQLDGFGWLSPKTRTITVKSGVHVEMTWDIEKKNCDVVLSPEAPTVQEPVAHLWKCLGRWSAYLVANGDQADCAPPSWLVDAVKKATPLAAQPAQPAPVPMTEEPKKLFGYEIWNRFYRSKEELIEEMARPNSGYHQDWIEANIREVYVHGTPAIEAAHGITKGQP